MKIKFFLLSLFASTICYGQMTLLIDTIRVKGDSLGYAEKKPPLSCLTYCYYKVDVTKNGTTNVLTQDKIEISELIRMAKANPKRGGYLYEIRKRREVPYP